MSDQDQQPSSKENTPEKRPPCLVTYYRGEQVRRGSSIYFSERGILVLCQEPAPLNTKMKMVLQFPGLRNPIEVHGEVVWTNIHGPGDSLSPRGMGVKFINLERDVERLLGELSGQYEGLGLNYSCYYT
jgi:hypothetical protein